MTKTILYARVSTDDQTCENQRIALENWAERNNIEEWEYISEEMTTRKTRPKKNQILIDSRKGHVGCVVVVRIDRWARNLGELTMDIEEMVQKHGVRFVSIENSFDFSLETQSATDRLMLHIFGAFAEFEKELLRERTIAGMARAKAQGKHIGRPKVSKRAEKAELKRLKEKYE